MQERVRDIVQQLERLADPDRAAQMARYMKTDMAFYGVGRPALDRLLRDALARSPIASSADYRSSITELWELPHREEKYAAITIARRQHRFVSMHHVDLYRRMIVDGAWWDLVDEFAHVAWQLLLASPDEMGSVLDDWITDECLWLRRVAILSQLDAKQFTDEARLFRYCTMTAHEREFFIRKAIGWALRQYARTAPDTVRAYCSEHREALSGLSFREATKHLKG